MPARAASTRGAPSARRNDWLGFLDNFREVLRLGREVAQRLSDETGLAPYDALMDQYEPGTTSAEVDRVFGDLQQWLPALVVQVRERQAREDVIAPVGPFPKAAQRALSLDVMALLGFDFDVRPARRERAHRSAAACPRTRG